jgi:hypothetical protein
LAPYQQTSAGLARWEAALGAITTFREAAKLLADLAGVQAGSETLRMQAERVGTELEGQQGKPWRTSTRCISHPLRSMIQRLASWWSKPTVLWCAFTIGIWMAHRSSVTGMRSSSAWLVVGNMGTSAGSLTASSTSPVSAPG